jgi:hypothetical protein
MTGLEVAEERERDASRQRRRDERAAAALAAADTALEAREEERREEQDLVEAAWVADTQLQPSQVSYLDANDDEDKQETSSSTSSDASDNEDDGGPSCQAGSQAQPPEISSSDESDNEPRRSSRVRGATRVAESQLSQIEKDLIPAPGVRAKVGALNAKKKQNTKVSQLDHEFKLIE